MEQAGPHLKDRLPELDGLRGLAILGVMVFHFLQPLPVGSSAAGVIVRCSRLGQTGVDLFFILSGFLIGGILIDTRGTAHHFRNFYARRTLRIFPLHYVALAVFFFVILPWVGLGVRPVHEQVWAWAYAVNVPATFPFGRAYCLPGHFWSLAVEEQFYLVWPLLLWAVTGRWLVALCVAMVPLAIAGRAVLAHYGLDGFYFTPCRADSLAIGTLVAILFRWRRPRPRTVMAVLAVTVAVCAPLWVATGGRGIAIVTLVRSTLNAVAYAVLLTAAIVCAERSVLKRVLTTRVLRFFGKYSYGLYVWHGMLPHPFDWPWIRAALPGGGGLVAMAVMCLVYGAISLAVALLSWHVLEKQCLRFKNYFEYHGCGPAHLDAAPPEPPETRADEDAAAVPAP